MSNSPAPSVLFVAGAAGDTGRYRVLHAGEQLCLAHASWSLRGPMERSLRSCLKEVAFVIFHRVSYDRHVEDLIREVENAGAVPLFDVDDLIFDPSIASLIANPKLRHPAYAKLHRDHLSRYRRTLERCHGVVVSTDYLAKAVRELGKRVWVHRNAFSLEMLSLADRAYERRPQSPRRVVIGYASGTPTHARDFEAAKPALRRILYRHRHVELWIVGHLDPGRDWSRVADRVRRLPFVPWRELPAILARFDINIAPLEVGNPFCRSKSELKYIEAALVRVPTIASATESFQYSIKSGWNGCLATGTDEWFACLDRMVNEPELRRKLGERAYQEVVARYHPAVRSRELVSMLNEISKTAQGRKVWQLVGRAPLSAVDICFVSDANRGRLQTPPLVARGLYCLRHRGAGYAALGVLYALTSWIPLPNVGGRGHQ